MGLFIAKSVSPASPISLSIDPNMRSLRCADSLNTDSYPRHGQMSLPPSTLRWDREQGRDRERRCQKGRWPRLLHKFTKGYAAYYRPDTSRAKASLDWRLAGRCVWVLRWRDTTRPRCRGWPLMWFFSFAHIHKNSSQHGRRLRTF
jgi:hypothetical protein